MRIQISSSSLPVIKSLPSSIPLSEAMVLGSVKHPQKFGGCYDTDANGITASCGIAAAVDAVTGLDDAIKANECVIGEEVFPILGHPVPGGCPQCGELEAFSSLYQVVLLDRVYSVIMHLNDDHRWSRPKQAEWVKSVEDSLKPQEAPSAVQAVEA